MKYTFSDGTTVLCEIVRKKNKNLYFRFNEDLTLVITAPLYISVKEIEKLIAQNEESLWRMYSKMEERVKDDDKFKYLGNKYYIVIDETKEQVFLEGKNVYTPSTEALDSFLNREMLRVFNEEMEIAKKCFRNLPEFTLRTRKMKTRWGVNDTKKKIITLNTELIKRDITAIDYVIIHELCHFYEPNHSKAFWQLVGEACPKYKEIRKSLKD